MNTKASILLISCITFSIGIILYALHHQWIIIRRTSFNLHAKEHHVKTKKICTFHYWHNNRWHTESQDVIWSPHIQDNLVTLINNWLSLLDAEQLLPKKVTLQSAALSNHKQDAYLSFDRNPLPKEWSTQRKWMLIEGLLKTIRSNTNAIDNIHLLVHHQPLIDSHLDFSGAWPVIGFISS